MSKLLGIGCLLVAMILSIACGGSDGGSNNSRSIAGAIDNSVLSKSTIDSGTYEVWAEQDGTRVKKGTITATSDTEDATYLIEGLVDGQTYEVTVYRVVGFDRVSVLSTVVTADANSGTLTTAASSKGRSKVLYSRQMNMVTTYVARKFVTTKASSTTTSVTEILTSVVTTVFGSATVSLDSVISEKGKLTDASGKGLVVADPVASAAVTQLTFATVAVTTMTATKVSEQKTVFESFTSSVTTATTTTALLTATTSSTSGLSNLVNAAVASSTSTAFDAAIQAADQTAAAVIADGAASVTAALTNLSSSISTFTNQIAATFSLQAGAAIAAGGTVATTVTSTFFSTLSTDTGISATVIQTSSTTLVQSAASGAGVSGSALTIAVNTATSGGSVTSSTDVTVTGFGLAHATAYGTTDSNTFTINTLAPVFKITFSSALPSGKVPTDIVKITVTNSSTSVTKDLSALGDLIKREVSSDGKTHYLMVKKSAAIASTVGSELQPGTTYTYAIEGKTGFNVGFTGGATTLKSGTIKTTDITMTLPFDGSSNNTSIVNLSESSNYNGITGNSVKFYIASKNWINYSPTTANTFGILGSTLSATINGSATADNSSSSLTIGNIAAGSSGWANGFEATLSLAVVTSGDYYLTFALPGNVPYSAADDGTSDGNLTTSNIPSRVDIKIQ